ncbi:MAG: DNA cytosine methyltransferase, partial [Clostridium sp.]
DFGIPQNRERVFCISILKDKVKFKFQFPEPIKLNKKLNDVLEKNADKKFYLRTNKIIHSYIDEEVSYCLDANYWKGTTLEQYLTKSRRQLVSGDRYNDNEYFVRRLTPLETWRLMGCTDGDFEKAQQAVSNTSLYKQAGNSIVVPVLESIFNQLFNKK